MINIKTYEIFINENNLVDHALNEGLYHNMKEKVSSLWNNLSFRNKMDISEKIVKASINTTISLWFGLLLYVFLTFADASSDSFSLPRGTGIYVNSIYWFLLYMLRFIEKKTNKLRKGSIENKIQELRDKFNPRWFDYMFIIIGERKDVNMTIQKLKEDELLTDKEILITDDIVIIDLSEGFVKREVNKQVEIDPFGEEIWKEEEKDYDIRYKNSLNLKILKKDYIERLEDVYNVRFRYLRDIHSNSDDKSIHNIHGQITGGKKRKNINMKYYNDAVLRHKDSILRYKRFMHID